ncbi:hypothetical protein C6370_18485 [Bacillus atrophaeus]|uniref:replicative helicase loader/inhibitor n=1 Tax=Bacillus atrophaeus TaxID=1452 RepID=UPI000D0803CB|nr:replicative helicase loader/inhibitor [Bacillus atrophaeus]MBT2626121.1 hypothetical protein [Bacillus sp. ISL-32]MEC0781527.1 replicative helicase loader/inhibitor [Bacillus atrophaeus]MEC0810176.1 replicative helicase loader/inhibitor [Bacillus atrophaeus]MEC0935451.1 replicative helicase loader/inhibitor [Bacillus atrophaeus]PSA91519.1 hypothetical protein C6370_18485 [Bacillus atrophaeus]
MKAEEAMKILKRLSAAYTRFDLSGEVGKERIELWMEHLKEMPFKPVLDKIKEHILNKPFPPAISEIKVKQPEKNEFLEQQKEWERNAKYSKKH